MIVGGVLSVLITFISGALLKHVREAASLEVVRLNHLHKRCPTQTLSAEFKRRYDVLITFISGALLKQAAATKDSEVSSLNHLHKRCPTQTRAQIRNQTGIKS